MSICIRINRVINRLFVFICHEISIAPLMDEIDDNYANEDNNAANIVETGDSENVE